MASDLNPGFENNINVIQIRTNGASMQRVTDRAVDSDLARTVISQVTETDGGVHSDNDVNEYTEGGQ